MKKNTYKKKSYSRTRKYRKQSTLFLILIIVFIALFAIDFIKNTFCLNKPDSIKTEKNININILDSKQELQESNIIDSKTTKRVFAKSEFLIDDGVSNFVDITGRIEKIEIKNKIDNLGNITYQNKMPVTYEEKESKIMYGNYKVESLHSELILAEKKDEEIKDLEGNIKNQLDKLDLSELEKFLSDVTDGDKIFNAEIKEILKQIINGTYDGGYNEFVKKIFSNVLKSIVDFLPMLVTIVAIAILFSLMNNLSSGFLNKSTTEIIYFVCYSAIIILVVTKTASLVLITTKTISSMQQLMNIIFPMLLTLVTALGGFVSVSAYKPMMAVASTVIVNVITKLVIPCFIAMLVFSIVGNMSKNIKLDKMNRFFKSIAEYTLGILFSLFMAFTTMQGITGAINDTISIKSAKFAIGSYVPVLGGYLSEGFDLILASCVLIKNSIGVVGIIIIMTIIFVPIIKIGVFALALKAIAGIIEPIGDRRMSDLLFGISKSLTMLIVAILGVAFMFFVLVMLVIYSCNVGIV